MTVLNIGCCVDATATSVAWRDMSVEGATVTSDIVEDALVVSQRNCPTAVQLNHIADINAEGIDQSIELYGCDGLVLSCGTSCKQHMWVLPADPAFTTTHIKLVLDLYSRYQMHLRCP